MDRGEEVRLQVYLSRSGIASRRGCEELIRQGKVTVNGETVTEMGLKVTDDDEIRYEGRIVEPEQKKIYLVFHKPVGYLCSNFDKYGRPLAIDLFQHNFDQRLHHVGRLDLESSGLIFYTNDGNFTYSISHPSFEIEKEYFLEAETEIPKALISEFRKGIEIDGVLYTLSEGKRVSRNSAYLTLVEGKNREIRRVFDHFGIPVSRLQRVRIGPVTIDNLPEGGYRHLTEDEIHYFLAEEKK